MKGPTSWLMALSLSGPSAWAESADPATERLPAKAAAERDAKALESRIRDFLPERSLARAGTPVEISAIVSNAGSGAAAFTVELTAPKEVRIADASSLSCRMEAGEERDVRWRVKAEGPSYATVRLKVSAGSAVLAESSFPMRFLPEMRAAPGYLPEPKPATTQLLIGAHHCPLWEADKPGMWAQIRKHMERVPALGFYAQESPEVSDWETAWAVEHGISFFIYCWYRTRQGGPVETRFSSAIHEGLFKSRYRDKMKFALMWENQARGTAGVSGEQDLLQNLLPYWIQNYFKHASYLKVDNRPVLFIYRPEFLIQDLGGEANVAQAFEKMRRACRDAGFEGLHLLGEYRGLSPEHLTLMKRIGLDYTFAYCWHVENNPQPEQAIQAQMNCIRKTQDLGILPQVVTVSQGWSGWRDEGSVWTLPPPRYEDLLRQAKAFVAGLPKNELGGRMLLLDNWNEWGEGHYLAPYTEHGFGYVDAVRKVFSEDPAPHVDLLPEDVGMGPYDRPYRDRIKRPNRRR